MAKILSKAFKKTTDKEKGHGGETVALAGRIEERELKPSFEPHAQHTATSNGLVRLGVQRKVDAKNTCALLYANHRSGCHAFGCFHVLVNLVHDAHGLVVFGHV